MKRKFVSEIIQSLVDTVYFNEYTRISVYLKEYLTSGHFEIETKVGNDESELMIYDSIIYPDFLPGKYFIDYTDQEHEDLEFFMMNVKDKPSMKIIKVFNMYRINQTIRKLLSEFIYSFFNVHEEKLDEKNLGLFKMKLSFVIEHISPDLKNEYCTLWKNVIHSLKTDTSVLSESGQPLGSLLPQEIFDQLDKALS